jgi:hypothetical protein
VEVKTMLFGLSDGKTSEAFDSLEKAVAAAQKWYKNRETKRVQLPPWNNQIADIFALNTAIKDYEARLAEALGYGDVYGPGNQLIETAAFQAGLRLHAYETGLGAGLRKAARRGPAQAQKQ